MVTVPISFHYNLGSQHGIPSKAKQIREEIAEEEKKIQVGSKRKAAYSDGDYMRGGKKKKKMEKTESELIHSWEKAAAGQFSEQKVHDILQKRFSNEPCLLVHEFKENDLVKVIKENIDNEKKENLKNNYLSQREFQFFKLTNRHFVKLEKQIHKMMETVIKDRFFEEDIYQILIKIQEAKPGHELLTEKQKKNYEKNIKEFLKKKFKDGAQYTKCKLKEMILEHFLNQTYPNSEYDLLLFLKVYVQNLNLTTLLHCSFNLFRTIHQFSNLK